MGKRLLFILVVLMMVRPITLVENLACGQETAASASSVQAVPDPIPLKDIPCSDLVKASEIAENGHRCPCDALMQPDIPDVMANVSLFTLFLAAIIPTVTAVARPPTPPPRLV